MSVQVVGEEIHFQGYLVALIANEGVTESVRMSFIDGLDNGTLFEGDEKAEAVAEFLRRAKELAKGGLLRYKELELLAQDMQGEFG